MIECYPGDLSRDWKQINVGVKEGSLRNFYQHHCFRLVILSKEEAGTGMYLTIRESFMLGHLQVRK